MLSQSAGAVPKLCARPLPFVKNNSLLKPKVARHFASVDSTNAALLRDLARPAPPGHGCVYLTDIQTRGRGQSENQWHASPHANLTLSLLLRPNRLPALRLFRLNQFASLSILDTLRTLLPTRAADFSVKWPNDVYAADRKIAGILIQNALRGQWLQWAVIGIGLNVNENDFPPPLRSTATSIYRLAGEMYDLTEVRDHLFTHLALNYELLTETPNELDRRYHDHLYRLGRPANYRVTATGRRLSGTITGTDAEGRLLIAETNGPRHAFQLREVSFEW